MWLSSGRYKLRLIVSAHNISIPDNMAAADTFCIHLAKVNWYSASVSDKGKALPFL